MYQSRSQAHVENRNCIIRETSSGADSKGDITCDMDLELYIAKAEIKAKQLIVIDGSTAFERCNGEPPRTVNSSFAASAVEDIDACIERTNDIDAKVVGQIYRRCNAMMEFKVIHSDKRSRCNRGHLQACRSKANPTTCWVTDKTGKPLHLRVDSLRPLSVCVTERLMPKGNDWNCVGKLGVSSPSLLLTINRPKSVIGCLRSATLGSSGLQCGQTMKAKTLRTIGSAPLTSTSLTLSPWTVLKSFVVLTFKLANSQPQPLLCWKISDMNTSPLLSWPSSQGDCKQYIMLLHVSRFGCFTWPPEPISPPLRTICMLCYCDAAP